MAERDDRFLSRWARLKEQEKAQSVEDAPKDAQPVAATEITGTAPEDDEAAREKLIAALPDIDMLDESSDFTVFLQSGVPEALRRRALRKLWRLNPVFANLDGLNDYDEDFTDAATVIEGLKTLYQVGKGMVTPEDEAAEAEAAEAETAESETAESGVPEVEEAVSDAEPEPAALCAPEPQDPEIETALSEPAETPEPAPGPVPGPVPGPARAAKRRWGQFDRES